MDSFDDPTLRRDAPDLLEPDGELDDPIIAAAMTLHMMRTMRVLERSQEAAEALQRIRKSSGKWNASQEAQIVLDAFRIVENVVGRVLPNIWWGEEGNETVERSMGLLRIFFEELHWIARVVELVGDPIQPDPTALGQARLSQDGKRGRAPSIITVCVRDLLRRPDIAQLCAPEWDGGSDFPYTTIKNTREVREALHGQLKAYPYQFDPRDIDSGVRGSLWNILNGIQRLR